MSNRATPKLGVGAVSRGTIFIHSQGANLNLANQIKTNLQKKSKYLEKCWAKKLQVDGVAEEVGKSFS